MARQVTFNTGFKYNFTFGVQMTEDITSFGGHGEFDKGCWNWTSINDMNTVDDAVHILKRLYEFEEKGYMMPKFYKYPKNIEGTNMIYHYDSFGSDKIKKIGMNDISEFRLGCLIYHQLLYQPNLSATFNS
jgi:hypothetical protein